MFKSVVLAATVAMGLGALLIETSFRMGSPSHDPFMAVGLLLAWAAGPVVLWRRRGEPFIPVAAIFVVLMSIILLVMVFGIAASHGMVDL